MFMVGFCGVSCGCGDLNSTTEALSHQSIFGEGIDIYDLFTIISNNMIRYNFLTYEYKKRFS
jgi:hypothetical protein